MFDPASAKVTLANPNLVPAPKSVRAKSRTAAEGSGTRTAHRPSRATAISGSLHEDIRPNTDSSCLASSILNGSW
jgi:hypothetical protein